MVDLRTAPYALFLLRITLGALLIVHFLYKLLVFTPSGTARMFAELGLLPQWAYLVMLVEVMSAIALIIGLWPRLAALAATPILLGSIVFFHAQNGFAFNAPNGGGWEYPGLWTICLLVQALAGDGAFVLRGTPVPAHWTWLSR